MTSPTTDLLDIAGSSGLCRFFEERFGAVPGEGEGVLHVAAVWRPPGEDRHVVLRIRPETPKSAIDSLLLNVARARAEAIVTTGRILREEPGVTHELEGPGRVPQALREWRERLDLTRPPWLLVLTSGRDLDASHPALNAWARPLVLCPAGSVDDVRGRLGGAAVEVVGRDQPGIRTAIDFLRAERGARRISIEAGPSTAAELYRPPVLIDELLLSVWREAELPEALRGGDLPRRGELERMLGPAREGFEAAEASGRWRFERYVRR